MIINILGNTTWGTTLAKVLSSDKNQVNLVFIDEKKLIKTSNESSIKVDKFEIPKSKNINYIFINEMTLNKDDTLIIAVPSCWIDVDTLDDLDAVAEAFRGDHGFRLRIATKYHRLVRDFLRRAGVADYQLVDSQGATEGTVKNLIITCGKPAVPIISDRV